MGQPPFPDLIKQGSVLVWNGGIWSEERTNTGMQRKGLTSIGEAEIADAVTSLKSFPNLSSDASVPALPHIAQAGKRKDQSWVSPQALLTAHYSVHNGFLGDDELLIHGVGRLRSAGVACIAVQGALDHVCPPRTALDLHEAWPEMQLRIVAAGGHSMYDAGVASELVIAT